MSDTEEEITVEAPEPPTPEPEPEPNDPLEDQALAEEAAHPEADADAEPDEESAEEVVDFDTGEIVARQVADERALAKRDAKLDGEKARHAKRVGEIMEEGANDLIPCPVCMDGIDGWIYPPEVQQLPPDAIARIRQVIGLPDYTTFRQATDAMTCPDCDGLGETVTGSHVPGYEVKMCGRCGKKGWVGAGQVAPQNGHTGEPEPVVTGPTVYQADEEDPSVKDLRERGWSVFPPLNLPA